MNQDELLARFKQATAQVTPQVTPQVWALLTHVAGEMTRQAIMEAIPLKDRKHFSDVYLQPALEAGLLEMTYPDKPRSSKQRYRLTERGLALLAEQKNNEPNP